MDKHEALNRVRIAAANVSEAHSFRIGAQDDHMRKTRALAMAETDALMAGATVQEVQEAAS